MRPLFRPEALQAQQQQWLGSVLLIRPLSLRWLTTGVLLSALLIGGFLGWAEYTRKAMVAGVLVPDRGLIRLVPSSAGAVLDRRIAEGQAVEAGDVLFVVALEQRTLDSGSQARVRQSLEDRERSLKDSALQQRLLAASRQSTLDRRLQALGLELSQIDAEAALQRQRILLAQQAQARLDSLQQEKFISSAQVQTKTEEVLGLQAQGQALERHRAALLRERGDIEAERSSLPLQARSVQGGIDRDLAVLSREAAEQDAARELVVRAPRAGIVSAVLAEPGQSVSPDSALASLVPEGAVLQAHLYAPSSAVGFVKAGQPVRLRFEAFPHQKFGHRPGRVVQVSRTPLGASELASLSLPAHDAERGGEPLFRITVALDPAPAGTEPLPLVAGMRLRADVLLERRSLAEWLFEPLAGVSGRL